MKEKSKQAKFGCGTYEREGGSRTRRESLYRFPPTSYHQTRKIKRRTEGVGLRGGRGGGDTPSWGVFFERKKKGRGGEDRWW